MAGFITLFVLLAIAQYICWLIVQRGLISQLTAYFALVYALGHLPATITSAGFSRRCR